LYKSQTAEARGNTTAYPAADRLRETEMEEMQGTEKRK